MRLLIFVGIVSLVGVVQCAPAISGSTHYNNPFTVESMLTRNRVKGGDLDPQTQRDLKILSFFEEELNKIFSCYIRLSCPRTRNAQVIRECQEIRDWPLYHQVMRMAGIRLYPYSNYAPSTIVHNPVTTVQPPKIRPTEVLDNGLSLDDDEDNEIDDLPTPTTTLTSIRMRSGGRGRGRMQRRRREHFETRE